MHGAGSLSLADDILSHAGKVFDGWSAMTGITQVDLRRSVSAAYYALFHKITEASVALVAPNVPIETNYRIQRWFEHTTMKAICGHFLKPKLVQPLLGLIGETASPELQTICRAFVTLQEARHKADYDPGYAIDQSEALKLLSFAADAFVALAQIRDTAEANIFILSLLLWKNWEKDRQP